MQIKKPIPLMMQENKPRALCPVCGKVSYSRGGIHPQCARAREDAPRIEGLRAKKKAEKQKRQIANLLPSAGHARRVVLP